MSDIYDYGFDINLTKPSLGVSTPTVYNPIDDAVNTSLIPSGGNLNLSTFSTSNFSRYISPGDDIQAAIDAVSKAGGGKVFFKTGTYKVNSSLVGRSGVDLIGENKSTTIIDFNSSPSSLGFTGTATYSTGTITSITSGVFVTGSGTSWLANVTPNHQFFIGNTWYKIAAVTSDTTLILSEGYQSNATLPGAAYRVAIIVKDVDIQDLTFQSSTTTAVTLSDCRTFSFSKIVFTGNSKGYTMTNISEIAGENSLSVSNTSNGADITNGRFVNLIGCATPSNGGHGLSLNNVTTGLIEQSSSTANTSDGYNLSSCADLIFQVEASGNGSQGIEMVSANDNINMEGCLVNGNVSDGIKLTATNTNCRITNSYIKNSGGFGINVAASTNGSIIIGLDGISNNSSGSINNLGTNTLIRSNQGAVDYP